MKIKIGGCNRIHGSDQKLNSIRIRNVSHIHSENRSRLQMQSAAYRPARSRNLCSNDPVYPPGFDCASKTSVFRRIECERRIQTTCQWPMQRVIAVLRIDHLCYPLSRFVQQCFQHHPVMSSVRNVLARNAPHRAVLHQAVIVNARHERQLRPSDTLISPAHHGTQSPLCVVRDLRADFVIRPLYFFD